MWRVLVEATYFTLSELGPFVAVVIAFFHQVNIYRDELQADEPTSADTGSTNVPTDDEFRRYFVETEVQRKKGKRGHSLVSRTDSGELSADGGGTGNVRR